MLINAVKINARRHNPSVPHKTFLSVLSCYFFPRRGPFRLNREFSTKKIFHSFYVSELLLSISAQANNSLSHVTRRIWRARAFPGAVIFGLLYTGPLWAPNNPVSRAVRKTARVCDTLIPHKHVITGSFVSVWSAHASRVSFSFRQENVKKSIGRAVSE